MTGRKRGVVKWFDTKKGFGFILDSDEKEHFIHYSGIRAGDKSYKTLVEGQRVSFISSNGEKGLRATDVVHEH